MEPTERLLTADQVRRTMADAYDALEGELVRIGAMPQAPRTVLQRFRVPLELLGAVQLGLVTASLATLVVFVVVNLLFHLHL